MVGEGYYMINLKKFSDRNPKFFNVYLLNFLGGYAKLIKDFDSEYIALNLRFSNGELEMDGITFVYPFIDKGLSFDDIYDIFINGYKSDLLYLEISII